MGKLLSDRPTAETPQSGCPTGENIAAFIDGRLDHGKRTELLAHFDACRECYEVFTGTLRSSADNESSVAEATESGGGRTSASRRPLRYMLSGAVAATVLVAFALLMDIGRSTYTEPSMGEKLYTLVLNVGAESLSELTEKRPQRSLGFAEAGDKETAFRAGTYLTNLHVSLMAEDTDSAFIMLISLISLLNESPDRPGHVEAIALYEDLMHSLEEGTALNEIIERSTDTSVYTPESAVLVDFGRWVQGGRLAAVVGDNGYFVAEDAEYFIDALKGTPLSEEVVTALTSIRTAIEANELSKLSELFVAIKEGM